MGKNKRIRHLEEALDDALDSIDGLNETVERIERNAKRIVRQAEARISNLEVKQHDKLHGGPILAGVFSEIDHIDRLMQSAQDSMQESTEAYKAKQTAYNEVRTELNFIDVFLGGEGPAHAMLELAIKKLKGLEL